jgi:hypothetical protein
VSGFSRTVAVVVSGFSRTLLLTLLVLAPSLAVAQDTHVLVIAGVGGDEEHVKKFDKWALAVVDAAKKNGVPAANITYLGENPDQSGGKMKARATRENVTKAFSDLSTSARRSTKSSSC